MNIRGFLLLVSVTLIGLGVWLKILERQEILREAEERRRFLPEFDQNSVAEVLVKTKESAVTLRKTPTGWVVAESGDQPANLAAIGALVQCLQGFDSRENVAADPSQFASFELLEPVGQAEGTGTLISLKDQNGKLITAVVVGKTSFSPPEPGSQFPPRPNGRFIVVAGTSGPVRVVAEGFDKLSARPEDWVEKPGAP